MTLRSRLTGFLIVVAAMACVDRPLPRAGPNPPPPICPPPTGLQVPGFHGGADRLGWNPSESRLTPERVASSGFGLLWESAPLDEIVVGDRSYAPHLYASPVYADDVAMTAGRFAGRRASVLVAASSNGWVYAINAFATNCDGGLVPAGARLWRARVGTPALSGLDGGVPVGVLSTPVLDLGTSPPRAYVAAADGARRWQVYALDLGSGAALAGWPVLIDREAVARVAPDGPPFQQDAGSRQRSALALSPDGGLLFLAWGGLGWMMAVDTRAPRLRAAFPGAPVSAMENAGIWAPGGPAIDAKGTLYATTGNGPESAAAQTGYWGESVLAWQAPLRLTGTYTPFNYCLLEHNDIDLGGSSPIVIPDLDPAATATPHLLAFGGKQGNVYLLDRDHLPGGLERRPPCSGNAAADGSLLPPRVQPQFGTPGPLSVFGPYSEVYGNVDHAKMRSTPAYFRDASGQQFLYVAGASKATVDSTRSVSPSLVRLRLVLKPGAPAYLDLDATDHELAFLNPGAPIVTSNRGHDPLVWVLDENAPRAQRLVDRNGPHPILYAIDGVTMKLRFRSDQVTTLPIGGKYATAVVAHGVVFVGTDRISAFGTGAPP